MSSSVEPGKSCYVLLESKEGEYVVNVTRAYSSSRAIVAHEGPFISQWEETLRNQIRCLIIPSHY